MSRTLFVTLKATSGVYGPKAIRFSGQTYNDLKERLLEANFPGYDWEAYVEIKSNDGQYVCLLDTDELPADDIYVTVQKTPLGDLDFRPPSHHHRHAPPHAADNLAPSGDHDMDHGPPRGHHHRHHDRQGRSPHRVGHETDHSDRHHMRHHNHHRDRKETSEDALNAPSLGIYRPQVLHGPFIPWFGHTLTAQPVAAHPHGPPHYHGRHGHDHFGPPRPHSPTAAGEEGEAKDALTAEWKDGTSQEPGEDFTRGISGGEEGRRHGRFARHGGCGKGGMRGMRGRGCARWGSPHGMRHGPGGHPPHFRGRSPSPPCRRFGGRRHHWQVDPAFLPEFQGMSLNEDYEEYAAADPAYQLAIARSFQDNATGRDEEWQEVGRSGDGFHGAEKLY